MSIESLVDQFTAKVDSLSSKEQEMVTTAFREVLGTHLAKPVTPKAVAKKSKADDKSDSDKKLNSWARIWTSTLYGGRTSFPEDYDRIKKQMEEERLESDHPSSKKRVTTFEVLARLRTELEGGDRWQQWYERIQTIHQDAPRDPPSERRTKTSTSPSTRRVPTTVLSKAKMTSGSELEPSPTRSQLSLPKKAGKAEESEHEMEPKPLVSTAHTKAVKADPQKTEESHKKPIEKKSIASTTRKPAPPKQESKAEVLDF